jgi:hypothetical protein
MARRTIATAVLFVSLSVLFVLSIPASASIRHLERDEMTGHIASTREEILATRERRKEQFGGRYEEMKQQMEEHTTGRRLLHETEFDRLERKMVAYERKLEHLHTEIDDRVRSSFLTSAGLDWTGLEQSFVRPMTS